MTLDPDLLGADKISELCKSRIGSSSVAQQLLLFTQACRHFGKTALSQISETDKQEMPPFKREYLKWIEMQTSVYERNSTEGIEEVLREVESSGYEGQMIHRIGHNLPSILRSQAEPLSFMKEAGYCINCTDKTKVCSDAQSKQLSMLDCWASKTLICES